MSEALNNLQQLLRGGQKEEARRYFWSMMMRPDDMGGAPVRAEFINRLAEMKGVRDMDGYVSLVKSLQQKAIQMTPKATYREQQRFGPAVEEFAAGEKAKREELIRKEFESYPRAGTREDILKRVKLAHLEKPTVREQSAKDLLFAVDVFRNFQTQYLAPIVAEIPGGEKAAIAMTPHTHFATEIEEKYGPWAVLPYLLVEASFGWGARIKLFGASLALASKVPATAKIAKSLLKHPHLRNAVLFGGFSGAEHRYQEKVTGRKPTVKETLIHTGIGSATGALFPITKVPATVAAKKELGDVVEFLTSRKMSYLRKLPDSELRAVIKKGLGSDRLPKDTPKELLNALGKHEEVIFKRIRKFGAPIVAKRFLGETFYMGAIGAGSSAATHTALGLPIDGPSLAQNATLMAAFHIAGLATHPPMGRPAKIKDGVLDLKNAGHQARLFNSFKFLFANPDMPPEQARVQFAENLKKAGVEAIRTTEGEVIHPAKVLAELNKATEPGSQALYDRLSNAYFQHALAVVRVPRPDVTARRAEIDALVAEVGRKTGQSVDPPTMTEPSSPLGRSRDVWELMLKDVTERFGEEGARIYTEASRTGKRLSEMKNEVADRIVAEFGKAADATIKAYREGLSGKAKERDPLEEKRARVAEKWGMELEQVPDEFVRFETEPIKSKEHYIELSEAFAPGYRERLKKGIGEEGYARLHEIKKGDDVYFLEEVGGGKYNVFKKGVPAGEKFHDALEPMSSYPATEIKAALGVEIPAAKPKMTMKEAAAREREQEVAAEKEKRAAAAKVSKKRVPTVAEVERVRRKYAGRTREQVEEGVEEVRARLAELKKKGAPESGDRTKWDELVARVGRDYEIMAGVSYGVGKEKGSIIWAREAGRKLGDIVAEASRWFKAREEALKRPIKAPESSRKFLTDVRSSLQTVDVHSTEGSARLRDFAKQLKLDVKGLSDDAILDRVDKNTRRLIYSATREKADIVGWDNDAGVVLGFDKAKSEYVVHSLSKAADVRIPWDKVKYSIPDEKIVKKSIAELMRIGREEAGSDFKDIEERLFTGPVPDPKAVYRTFEGVREKILTPAFVDRVIGIARMISTWVKTRDSLLTSLSRVFYGSPRKTIGEAQWARLQKVMNENRDNPWLLDGKYGTVSPRDFISGILGRSNWDPAIDVEIPHEPLTRKNYKDILKSYMAITDGIKNRNWGVIFSVGLPQWLVDISPGARRFYDNLTRFQYGLDSMNAEAHRTIDKWTETQRIRDWAEVNPKTKTEVFRAYNRKKYGKYWDGSIGDRREELGLPRDRWERYGRSIGDEVRGLSEGTISPKEPYLDSRSLEIYESIAKSDIGKLPVRERWWRFLNNTINRRLGVLDRRLRLDDAFFLEIYPQWKMDSPKTTPENGPAMLAKFTTEATSLLADTKARGRAVNAIVEGKRLGKIVDRAGRSVYYPRHIRDEMYVDYIIRDIENLEQGVLPQGRVGEIMYAKHRKTGQHDWLAITGETRKGVEYSDVRKDWLSYFQNVGSFAWRTHVQFESSKATRRLTELSIKNPKYAEVLQRHIELVNKIRGDILTPTDSALDILAQSATNMAAAVFLPFFGTVFRNYAGGTFMTWAHHGMGYLGKAVRMRGTKEGQALLERETGFGESATTLSDVGLVPRKWEIQRKLTRPELQTLYALREVTRRLASYALNHPIPIILDWVPGANKVLKPLSFVGSERLLREISYLAGWIRAYEETMNGPDFRNKVVAIQGRNASYLAKKVRDKYDIPITEELASAKMKFVSGEGKPKRYSLTITNAKESLKEKKTRARIAARTAGIRTVAMTQFEYSRMNVSKLITHPVGRTVLVFRRYTMSRFGYAMKMIKELNPRYGADAPELSRLLRFGAAIGGSLALSRALNINLYRFVEDDVVSLFSNLYNIFSEDANRRKQAFYGKEWYQYMSGAIISVMMDALTMTDLSWPERLMKGGPLPYGRAFNSALRQAELVRESRKNTINAIANMIGVYLYNFGKRKTYRTYR